MDFFREAKERENEKKIQRRRKKKNREDEEKRVERGRRMRSAGLTVFGKLRRRLPQAGKAPASAACVCTGTCVSVNVTVLGAGQSGSQPKRRKRDWDLSERGDVTGGAMTCDFY